MRFKLELDFQFWRFFVFGLFAALVALAIAVYSFKFNQIPIDGFWSTTLIVLIVLFGLSLIMFFRNYFRLRKILK